RHIQAARRAIETGALGKIRFLDSVLSTTNDLGRRFPPYRKQRALGGGALIDLAVAHFDLWRHLLGEEVAEISSVSCAGGGVDKTAAVIGRMNSGVIATSLFSEDAAEQHQIAVHGERARIEMSLHSADGYHFSPSGTFSGDPRQRLTTIGRAIKSFP